MSASTSAQDNVLSIFGNFRTEIDEHHDRRERLIKNSRDVTNLSKKIIFLIHRLMTEDLGDSSVQTSTDLAEQNRARALRAASTARGKLKEIQALFAAIRDEVAGERFWRYQRNVSGGLQEYIEALSFAHYLETGALVSFNEVQESISDEKGPYFPLTLEDYVLGLSDLTGELMRYAISSIARRGGRTKASEVCTFVRACRADFEGLVPYFRELGKKQKVTSQSLEKIEDAAYAIVVRSSEYDLSPEILDDIVANSVSRLGSETRRRRGREDDGDDDDDG